jgi:hypothetical protein
MIEQTSAIHSSIGTDPRGPASSTPSRPSAPLTRLVEQVRQVQRGRPGHWRSVPSMRRVRLG